MLSGKLDQAMHNVIKENQTKRHILPGKSNQIMHSIITEIKPNHAQCYQGMLS